MKLKLESPNKPELKPKIKINFKSKYSSKDSEEECNNNILGTFKKNCNGDGPNKPSILDKWLIKIYSKSSQKQKKGTTQLLTVTDEKASVSILKAPELIVKLVRLNVIQLKNGEYVIRNIRGEINDGTVYKNNCIKETDSRKSKQCIDEPANIAPINQVSTDSNQTRKCPHCPFETKSLSNFHFYKHVRSHVKQETEKCPVCHKDINWFSYKTHLKSHTKKREGLCYTKPEKKKYQCVKCDYITNTSCNINLHYHANHSDKVYKCNRCPFETKMVYYFNNHVKGHERKQTEKCRYCKKDIKWFSYKTHLKTHERNDKTEKKCDLCDYKSYNGANVKRHMLTHKDFNEVEKFGCHLCGFVCISKDNLNNHIKLVHTKEGKWSKCEKCDYSTRRPAHLARHLLIHSRTSVQCTDCLKYYTSERNLETHRKRAHIDDVEKRYFYCELCPKDEQYKTTEKGNLKRHMLSHRTKKELELFSCDKCPYMGKCKRALKEHILSIHMPELHGFKCSACDYTTPYRSRFNLHQREVHEKKKIRVVTQRRRRRTKNTEEIPKTNAQNTNTDTIEEQSTCSDEEVDTDNEHTDSDDDEPVGIMELEQFCSDIKHVGGKVKLSESINKIDAKSNDNFEDKSKVEIAKFLGESKIKQQELREVKF